MTMNHWPLAERPREKLLLYGAKHLSDAELLAIFLNTGIRGKTALDIARELLHGFGSLRKLLQSHAHELCQTPGVGKAKYVLINAAIELGLRYLTSDIQLGKRLNSSQLTKQFLSNHLKHYAHEVFAGLFLDTHHRLICFEELFHGTLNEASVYPREVVKRGLLHNAAHIILAHNHPSGSLIPSEADHQVTHLLKQALLLVDIQVIDHILVGHHAAISFAEQGWL